MADARVVQFTGVGRKSVATIGRKQGSSASSNSSHRTELRCLKYSPSVKPPKFLHRIESHEYEAKMWRGAFDSMGTLKKMGLAEVKTFTRLAKQPYHCPAVSREFKVSLLPQKSVTYKLPEEKNLKYLLKIRDAIRRITIHGLPRRRVKSTPFGRCNHVMSFIADEPYFPPSAVRMYRGEGVTDNLDLLSDWLSKTFGPIEIIVVEGPKRCVVIYAHIISSYETVNAGINPALLSISWCDTRFYNFGHFNMFSNYRVTDDGIWNGTESDLD